MQACPIITLITALLAAHPKKFPCSVGQGYKWAADMRLPRLEVQCSGCVHRDAFHCHGNGHIRQAPGLPRSRGAGLGGRVSRCRPAHQASVPGSRSPSLQGCQQAPGACLEHPLADLSMALSLKTLSLVALHRVVLMDRQPFP